MEVLEALWFSNITTTGIIVAKDKDGEVYVYTGTGIGYSQELDTQHVLENGTKIKIDKFLEPLLKHLDS